MPVDNRIDRPVEIGQVMDFVLSDDPRTKIRLEDGTAVDYIPTKRIALPVNKENVLASGIVAEKDRDLIVDTVYINLRKNALDKSQLMLLDMLANFDWKRPIFMTQVYVFRVPDCSTTSSSTAMPIGSCPSSRPWRIRGRSGASTPTMRCRF